jgi:hypothetical protein
MPYFSQQSECSFPPRSSLRSTLPLHRSPTDEAISSPEKLFGTASLSSVLLQSAFEPFIRGACFAAVGLLSKPKMPQGQPKDICYRWQLDINSSESSLETESVRLTELGSEGPFSVTEAQKSVDVDRGTAKGSQQQIPP